MGIIWVLYGYYVDIMWILCGYYVDISEKIEELPWEW